MFDFWMDTVGIQGYRKNQFAFPFFLRKIVSEIILWLGSGILLPHDFSKTTKKIQMR
jgi:hypothetical protein